MINLSDIIREYGEAFRGDWSSYSIDGRSVLMEMNNIADLIDNNTLTFTEDRANALRDDLGICPRGHGHWSHYCDDYCEHGDEDEDD